MINIIKPESIKAINDAAAELMKFLKANKIYFVDSWGETRAGASTEIYNYTRALANERRERKLKGDAKAIEQLAVLVGDLTKLLGSYREFKVYKVSDYSKPEVLLKKMSRDTISNLEDMYVLGEVTQADIEQVYANIGKPVAKKFKFFEIKGEAKKLYAALSKEIRNSAAQIKAGTFSHYEAMAERIDPTRAAETPKEFLKLAFKKLSDIDAIRMCMACRFKEDSFQEMINHSFEMDIAFAAIRIIDHCNVTDSPKVSVNEVRVGGKGFDMSVNVNGRVLRARAIPVEGYYVRFHYRYIIT